MKAGKLLKLAAPQYVDSHAEHLRADMIGTLNVVLQTADAFNADLALADADANLSADGKHAARNRVAATALAALDAVQQSTIAKLSAHAASIESKLLGKVTYQPPTDAAARIAHEAHLREIREQLRGLSQAERANMYRTTDDAMVLAAIDTAPQTLSAPRQDGSRRMEDFIDPAERTAARLERAEQADPVAAALLREVRSVAQVYSLAVATVRREILDEVGQAAGDAVPAMR